MIPLFLKCHDQCAEPTAHYAHTYQGSQAPLVCRVGGCCRGGSGPAAVSASQSVVGATGPRGVTCTQRVSEGRSRTPLVPGEAIARRLEPEAVSHPQRHSQGTADSASSRQVRAEVPRRDPWSTSPTPQPRYAGGMIHRNSSHGRGGLQGHSRHWHGSEPAIRRPALG